MKSNEMERKGNIDILDETKDDVVTPRKTNGESDRLKGNIDIIDETTDIICEKNVKDEHLKVSSGNCSKIVIDPLDEGKYQMVTSNPKNSNDNIGLNINVCTFDEEKEKVKHVKELPQSDRETGRNSNHCAKDENQFEQTSGEGAFKGHVNNETDTTAKIWTQQKDRILNVNKDTYENILNPDVDNGNISADCEETSADFSQKEQFNKDHIESYVDSFKHKNLNDKQERRLNPFDQKRSPAVSTTHMKVSLEPESSSVGPEEKASDICSDPCDFCERTSDYMCKYCKYFYCKECLDKLHPALGPYKSHRVIPTNGGIVIEHHEKCSDHGLVAQLFCSYCEQKRCAECANTRCYLHFKGKVSEADIEREKAILVDELEKATAKLGFLDRYKEKVESELDNIEITGLLRREQIKQEFVSFHELLIQEEATIIEKLDEDIQERRDHVRGTLQTSVATLEREDAVLSTTVTELVQSENAAQFIEDCVMANDLCSQIDDTVSKFDRTWAKNSTYSRSQILNNQFSMFLEKKQLLKKLEKTADKEPQRLHFKQNTLFLDDKSGPLEITDYLQMPVVPTSTQVCYTVQVLVSGKLVYEKKTRDFRDIILNTESTIRFVAGNRYLLKVFPAYKCFISSIEQHNNEGNPTHLFIVTDYMFKAQSPNSNGDRPLIMANHQRLLLRKHHKEQTYRKLRTVYSCAKKKFAVINTGDHKWLGCKPGVFKTCKTFEQRDNEDNKRKEAFFTKVAKKKGFKERKSGESVRRKPKCKDAKNVGTNFFCS